MRVTLVLHAQNLGNKFKFCWLTQARKKIREDGMKAALTMKGISIVEPKDVLTPVLPREEVPPRPPALEELYATPPPEKRHTPCYTFTHRFSPVMGLAQAQLITNTLIHTSLPQAITNHAQADKTTPDMHDRVKGAIMHAHLLDSFQTRLPRIHDVINNPGWIFPREYGIPTSRKNKTFNYQLLLLLDQVEGCGLERQLVENSSLQVMLHHGDHLMQMKHDAGYLVSSPNPLPPVASPEEMREASESKEMPDLYPMSPFINCHTSDTYQLEENYAVESPLLHPHTIFIHHNQPRMPHTHEVFKGMTLLYAFSHAAAYAKLIKKQSTGDLEEPITVQIVHTNCRHYHLGVFQLNTLNLSPSSETHTHTRNLFWTQDWDVLFDSCKFKAGKPVLQGYNPLLFDLLRGFHAQG